MLGTIMFCSKLLMEALPNVHLLGMLTMVYTVVYRVKALVPIYLFVLLNGLFFGFSLWWFPYLYVWTLLWGVTMLLPKDMPDKVSRIVYPTVCCLHGLLFGILYAPGQALMFGLDFKQTLAWIVSGFPFDLVHAVGNLIVGILIVPLSKLLNKIKNMAK